MPLPARLFRKYFRNDKNSSNLDGHTANPWEISNKKLMWKNQSRYPIRKQRYLASLNPDNLKMRNEIELKFWRPGPHQINFMNTITNWSCLSTNQKKELVHRRGKLDKWMYDVVPHIFQNNFVADISHRFLVHFIQQRALLTRMQTNEKVQTRICNKYAFKCFSSEN